MRKLIIISITSFIISIACIIGYKLIGSHIASDGTLVEPFALIPLGYLSAAAGSVSIIIYIIRKLLTYKR